MTSTRMGLFSAALLVFATAGPAWGLIDVSESQWGNEGAELDGSGNAWWSFSSGVSNGAIGNIPEDGNDVLTFSHGPTTGVNGGDGNVAFSGGDKFWDTSQGHNADGEFTLDARFRASISSGGQNRGSNLNSGIQVDLPTGVRFNIMTADARTGQDPTTDNSPLTINAHSDAATAHDNTVFFAEGLSVDWTQMNVMRLVSTNESGSQRMKVYLNGIAAPVADVLVGTGGGTGSGDALIGNLQPRYAEGFTTSESIAFDFIRMVRTASGTDAEGFPLDGPPLPEPASLALLLIGGTAILGRRR